MPDALPPQADLSRLPGTIVRQMPRVLSRLTGLALRYPLRCATAVACGLGAALLNLVTPRLLGAAVDQAHGLLSGGTAGLAAARGALWQTALLIVAAAALRGVLTGYQGYLGEYIAHRVGYDLRLAFYEKLQRLSFSFHDSVHSGELITRGMLDLEGVRAFLESGLLRVITLALLVGVGAWRVLATDMVAGAAALSFVPFVIWRAARMGVLLRVTWMRLQELMALLTRAMEENLQGVRVVRAFAATAYEMGRFDRAAATALALSNRRVTIRMASMSAMNLGYYAAMGLVLLVGGRRVAEGAMTVGALTEILAFMTILQQPLRQVAMVVNASARATSSGARLFEILDLEPEIRDRPGARDLVVSRGVLRFERVGFAYPGHDGPALQDISFAVEPGRTLGIVGPPGSGKSTIAQLVPRLYDVSEGRITIDGQDIRDVTLDSLRRTVSLVQQDTFLFDATIRDNVAYAEPWAGEEEVIGAAAVAQLHDHVVGLPEGYGTTVGERGVALSGGQRQRLSIARGLAPGPSILVLDDSTAAVDAVTERRVREGLNRAVGDKAHLIVAHRLGALSHADEIIVLEAGRIVERGSHEALLAADGEYAALWRLQNRQPAEDAGRPLLAEVGQ